MKVFHKENCYVTGIFNPKKENADGAGFSIDASVETKVIMSRQRHIFINYKTYDSRAITSNKVIDLFQKQTSIPYEYIVWHKLNIPISHGFSTSAAAALSLAKALNKLNKNPLTNKQVVELAHKAEILAQTGMSAVDAIEKTGFILGKSNKIKKISAPKEIYAVFATFGPISTKILFNNNEFKQLKKQANLSLKALSSNPDYKTFLIHSHEFALNSGIAEKFLSNDVFDFFIDNEQIGMNMIGKVLFTLCEKHHISNKIRLFSNLSNTHIFFKRVVQSE